MKREFLCVSCPVGCHLTVEGTGKDDIVVSGNKCKRGISYALDEITAPKRMVTSSVRVKGGDFDMVCVKSSKPILKTKIFEALDRLRGVEVTAPISIGQVVVADVDGDKTDFVATRRITKK